MKFLVFGDPHITPQCEFGKPDQNGLTDYLKRAGSSLDWISDLVVHYTPDVVVCLGDLFDSTGYVETSSLTVVSYACSKLSHACLESNSVLFFLLGNHDIYSKNFNNLSFMDLDPNINIINKETTHRLGDQTVQLIPWTEDEVVFDKDANVIFSHLLIKGGYLYKDKVSEKGIDCKYGVDQVVFNGHHHRNQILSKNFYNVGSLLSRTFQDVNSGNKGAYLYDSDDGKSKFIVNPYEISFKEITIDSEKVADTIIYNISEGHLDYSDSYVRIKFDPNLKAQADDISCLAKDCRLESIQQKPDLDKSFTSDLFSIDENYREYALSHVEDDYECNKLIDLGLSYINKVNKEHDIFHKMSLEFLDLTVINFQSIDNFSVNLYGNGLIALVGSNGSGKSSFLESIYWVLTGDSIRGYKGDDVIKWDKSFCEVYLVFTVGGEKYCIRRKKERKKSYELDVALVSDNSDGIRRSSDSEKVLSQLLGRTKDIFKHSVFLTSDLSTRFTSLSYPDRVRLIERITNLDMYAIVEKEVLDDLNSNKKNLLVLEGRLSGIEILIKNLETNINKINDDIVGFKSSSFNLDDQKDLLVKYTRQLDLYEIKRAELEGSREDLKSKLYNSDLKSRELSFKISKVSLVKASSEKERSLLIKKREEIEELIENGKCHVCGSSTENNEYIDSELVAVYESIDICDSKILKCSNKMDNFNNESSDLLSNGKVVRESINKIALESKVLNESNNKLVLKKDVLTNKIKDYLSKLDQLLARKDELEKTLKSSESDCVVCVNELATVTSNMVRLNFVSQAFSPSGMRAVILESIAISFMNERLEHYSKMVGFSCYLTNKVFTKSGDKRNKIDVALDERKTYKGCSRGEKRRIDLCIQCAINDLAIASGGSNINLLVADEIIDPLDDGGVNGFVGILKEKYQKQSNATMLLVSHKPFFSELLDSKWLFSSNGGSTSIEIANV